MVEQKYDCCDSFQTFTRNYLFIFILLLREIVSELFFELYFFSARGGRAFYTIDTKEPKTILLFAFKSYTVVFNLVQELFSTVNVGEC